MNPIAAKASVVRNYLDWIFAIPWGKRARICKNLRKAETFLDENHYGLDKVKERILEFLAVQNRVDKVNILCVVGPPGRVPLEMGKSRSFGEVGGFARCLWCVGCFLHNF